MARRTKATAAVLGMLSSAMATGATLRGAASSAGISVRTLHRWIKRGFRGDGDRFQLARAIVHEARRLEGVVVVRTSKGLAFRRRPIRRPTLDSFTRELDELIATQGGWLRGKGAADRTVLSSEGERE